MTFNIPRILYSKIGINTNVFMNVIHKLTHFLEY